MNVPTAEEFDRIAAIQDEHRQQRLAGRPGLARAPTTEEVDAAAVIQRTYRGHRTRRQLNGMGLDASDRWMEAMREARFRNLTTPHPPDETPRSSQDTSAHARENWRRVATIARQAGHDDPSDSDSESSSSEALDEQAAQRKREDRHKRKVEREKTAKMMDLQYFLEMVDVKHRYGSNLRAYHEEWKKADTHENFFYWLDYGAGRLIELPNVSRSRLEAEQVRYLSREERQQYLVKVDKEGRLCWARNGERISTTPDWKDSVKGVVPKNDPTPAFREAENPLPSRKKGKRDHLIQKTTKAEPDRSDASHSNVSTIKSSGSSIKSTSSSTSSLSSSTSHQSLDKEMEHYLDPEFEKAHGLAKIKHMSTSVILNQLLIKTIKPNSWIFVADTNFRLYVGIKQSGAFQHSSFLNGARIMAAGLIKIKDGQLRKLSPLSGHYRPPVKNFRQFEKALREAGVDMSRVSVSRAIIVLAGLEAYVRTRRRVRRGARKVMERKDRLIHPDAVRQREEERRDKSRSAAREREVLAAQQREEEEARQAMSLPERVKSHLSISGPEDLTTDPSLATVVKPATPIHGLRLPLSFDRQHKHTLSAAEKAKVADAKAALALSEPGQDAEDGVAPEGSRDEMVA